MELHNVATRAVALLKEKGLTVATAESWTGGLSAAAITDVAGASRVFGTGVVSYCNDCKIECFCLFNNKWHKTKYHWYKYHKQK